ncbi:MAG TPA: VCBS repeat-containing protein [Terriglobales bacterium]|nr:VCBS repeat-containing protein [Terriglobales bacterium]
MSRRQQRFASLTITLITFCLVGPGFATGFRAARHFNVGSHPVAIAAGDFDGDGNLDLAVLNNNRSVSVLTGLGDGTFRDRVDYTIGVDGRSIVVADVNGDGKADIAIGSAGTRTVSVLAGRGDGSFQNHSESSASHVSGALVTLLNNQKTYQTAAQTVSVVFGDFNRDGLEDQAVTSSRNNNVSILLGTKGLENAAPPATNLLMNPGFESGALSPWVQGRDFCSSPCRNWAAVQSMPKAGKFDGGDEGNIELVQNFTATSTSSLTKVALWVRHPAGSQPIAADLFYTDGTDDEFVAFTTDANWDALDFTADLATGKMLDGFSVFGFSGGGSINMNTFIDNAVIH